MTTIKLQGKATASKAASILEMCQEALRESQDPIHVDWSDIEAIDASVLQILLALKKERPVQFSEPPQNIRQTLSMIGLAEQLR